MQLHYVQRLQHHQKQCSYSGEEAAHLSEPCDPVGAQRREQPQGEHHHQQIAERADEPYGLLPAVKIKNEGDGAQAANLPETGRKRDSPKKERPLPVSGFQAERKRQQHQKNARRHSNKTQRDQRGFSGHQQHGKQRLTVDEIEGRRIVPDAVIGRRQRDRYHTFGVIRVNRQREPVIAWGASDVGRFKVLARVDADRPVERKQRISMTKIDNQTPTASAAV